MSKRLEKMINLMVLGLVALVIFDHVLQFSYHAFFEGKREVRAQGYMEILSLMVTIMVPAFYRLYKNRENRLENAAIAQSQGQELAAALENARTKLDIKSFAYYLASGVSLVVCLFFQSTVLNAEKIESKNQEQRMQEIIKTLNEVEVGLNERTSELRALLQSETTNWREMRKKLEESLGNITGIQSQIGGLAESVQSVQPARKPSAAQNADAEEQYLNIIYAINALDAKLVQHFDESNQKIESLKRKITGTPSGSTIQKLLPDNKATDTKVLADPNRDNLLLLSALLDEWQSLHGNLPELVPGQKETANFYSNFLTILRNKGMSRNEVKAMLNGLGEILNTAPEDMAALEQETGIANLARKINNLNWLKWRMGFVL